MFYQNNKKKFCSRFDFGLKCYLCIAGAEVLLAHHKLGDREIFAMTKFLCKYFSKYSKVRRKKCFLININSNLKEKSINDPCLNLT